MPASTIKSFDSSIPKKKPAQALIASKINTIFDADEIMFVMFQFPYNSFNFDLVFVFLSTF